MDAWAPPARALFEALQSLLAQALAPLPDHLAPGVQTRRDLVVGHPSRRLRHELSPDDVSIRQRLPARPPLKDAVLLRPECHDAWVRPGHGLPPLGEK